MSCDSFTSFKINFSIVELEPDNYHILVKAKLDGHPLNVILDTGASHTCFDTQFVSQTYPELETEENEGLNVGVGSNDFESKITDIHNFRMGRFVIKDYQVVLLDMSNINSAYQSMKKPLVHSIIGSDFFVKYNAVIDFENKVLMLKKK